MNELTNYDTTPLDLGLRVHWHRDICRTGRVVAVRSGSTLFPGWHYDVALDGSDYVVRAVPAADITAA